MYLEALKTTSCGILQVITAQDLRYMRIPSLKRFNTINPGLKNIPIHIIPWLSTKWSIFSAILKSPYWGNCFSRSQHQQPFMNRTKTARIKSMVNVFAMIIIYNKKILQFTHLNNLKRKKKVLQKNKMLSSITRKYWIKSILLNIFFIYIINHNLSNLTLKRKKKVLQ